MAAGTIAAPGTEAGPCADEDCGHRYCNFTREDAGRKCAHCDKPIGYDARFYVIDRDELGAVVLAHAACHEEA